MYAWLKNWIVISYDSWCESMGLVEANRRRVFFIVMTLMTKHLIDTRRNDNAPF